MSNVDPGVIHACVGLATAIGVQVALDSMAVITSTLL